MDKLKFYGSSRWKAMRESVLRRDGYKCQNCKRYGKSTPATTVHHIKHFEDHPELALDPKNLVSLCEACHNKEHPEKALGHRRTY